MSGDGAGEGVCHCWVVCRWGGGQGCWRAVGSQGMVLRDALFLFHVLVGEKSGHERVVLAGQGVAHRGGELLCWLWLGLGLAWVH